MTANYRFSPPIYSIEKNNWFRITEADVQQMLDDGVHEAAYYVEQGDKLFVRFQGLRGHWGTPLQVNVPLCKGCEQPLDNGICDGCEVINADAPDCSYVPLVPTTVSDLGDDVFRVSPR